MSLKVLKFYRIPTKLCILNDKTVQEQMLSKIFGKKKPAHILKVDLNRMLIS